MKLTATIMIAMLLPTLALAQPLPVPKPSGPGGSRPHGWLSSGSYCVPSAGAQDAVPRPPGGSCVMDGVGQLLPAQRQRRALTLVFGVSRVTAEYPTPSLKKCLINSGCG
jgi:hypothetical protein